MSFFTLPKRALLKNASPSGDGIFLRSPFSAIYLGSFLTLAFLVLTISLPAFAVDTVTSSPQIAANAQNEGINGIIFGLFMGVLLTAAAYLFFIWIVMRDRGQVSLICLLVCLALYIASTNNILMDPMGLHTANSARTPGNL